MMQLEGYQITKLYREGRKTLLYRGMRDSDKTKVVIKIIKDEIPTVDQLERFKYEYELIQSLEGQGTVHIFGLEKIQKRLAIVMEDFGTETLKETLAKKRLPLSEFLNIALNIVEALEIVHQNNIIHKDINPSNILYNPTSEEIKIIDFGIASTLSREIATIASTEEGTLYYISPEQTGRMNRGIDYRTDFYSLGMTFYHMATGVLPFNLTDVAEIFHFHIAKLPTPPHDLDPQIPLPVSNIIMKLLEKTAEERYQSTYGLKEDLINCINQLKEKGAISDFEIGTKDVSAQFHISEKLYGREEELQMLMNAFHSASLDRAKLILVSGYAGIGKSTLVQELYKPLVEKKGYFISGKFDQFKRNIPYSSLAQAFQGFIEQILTKGPEEISSWRERLQNKLGHNAQVVVDVIPNLSKIIGEQEPVPVLGLNETQNRFNIVFQNFILALATPSHPIAIFLDDLQWADLPSLKLLETLLLFPESKYFLIIGAYRDNEVDDAHILTTTLEQLRKANFFFNTIILKPLEIKDIIHLLKDTIHHDDKKVQSLAEICFEKTQGNPFFLNQFLSTLYSQGLLEFDLKEGGWYWDIELINKQRITNNVVELMIRKLRELSHKTQNVLQIASCLGNRFDLNTLSYILDKSKKQTSDDMWEALQKGLIIAVNDNYKYVTEEENVTIYYQFLHDRVQQAAYLLIEEDKKPELHLKIGRILLQHIPEEHIKDNVQEIVNQINHGLDLVLDDNEKRKYAELNLMAGKKAKASIAYRIALNYFQMGMTCLNSATSLMTDYETVIALYTEAMEAAFLSGDFKEMNIYYDFLLKNAKNLLDKVKCYEIKILYHSKNHEWEKSIEIIIYLLSQLGIRFPANPKIIDILRYLFRTKFALYGKSYDALAKMPLIKDPIALASLKILRVAATSTYIANPKLFLLCVFQSIMIIAKHGNTPTSCRNFIAYSHILCGALNNVKTGYQYGKLALRLMDDHKSESVAAQTNLIFAAFISHYVDPLSKCRDLILTAYLKSLETGDIEYAGFSTAIYNSMSILMGVELKSVMTDLEHYGNALRTMEHPSALLWHFIILRSCTNLIGQTDATVILNDSAEKDAEYIQGFYDKNDNIGLIATFTFKIMLHYLYEEYETGIQYIEKGLVIAAKAIGIFLLPTLYTFSALIYLMLIKDADKNQKRDYFKKIKKYHKISKRWNTTQPFQSHLVSAEIARVQNKHEDAIKYYDLAIEEAKKLQFLHIEALANELAAKYYLSKGSERIAKAYMTNAYHCYKAWGATKIVKRIETRYHHLLMTAQSPHLYSMTLTATTTFEERGDLKNILKAAQLISSEMELESLLKRIVSCIQENVPAENIFILLVKDQHLYIQATSLKEQPETSALMSKPVLGSLPMTIIQEVERNHNAIVLVDALHDDQFSQDPYIQSKQVKSIICLPLFNQGVLRGMLYLENNSYVGVFKSEVVNFLRIISSQIIIAIDNAESYTQKKLLSEAYQRFVPKVFIELLKKPSIVEIKLGDAVEKDMTILVCDIRNFTSISEKMSSQENINFINQYLLHLEPIISRCNGFIERYIGDAITALFKSADDAVKAGIEIFYALSRYNETRTKMRLSKIEIGIGINSGHLILGTVGTKNRLQGTVVSTEVHIAEATEELTKKYHLPLLITEETYLRLEDPHRYFSRKIDNVNFIGKSIPLGIYEIYDFNEESVKMNKAKVNDDFQKALTLFQRNKYNQALIIFENILKLNTEDTILLYFVGQCQTKKENIL